MLTVMYRDEEGQEHLYEAAEVRKISPIPPSRPCEPGREDGGIDVTVPPTSPLKSIFYPFRRTAQSETPGYTQPTVFVMNEAGKTVARYPL